MIQPLDNPAICTCTCEAMYTTFTLRLDCPDMSRAEEAASACINQMEGLESDLSRFRHDSDVSRINNLGAGEQLLVSENTYACLRQAFALQAITGGLFDVTLGACTRPDGHRPDIAAAPGAGQLELAPDRPLVTCIAPGRQIDLGGIGKGFALDQLAKTLESYRIDSALLCAGASTMLARGRHSWPIALTGNGTTKTIELQGRALSASGIGIQGAHVVHPDHPDKQPHYRFERVWLITEGAATADACSTACLLMNDDEIATFSDFHHDDMTLYVEAIDDPEIRRL